MLRNIWVRVNGSNKSQYVHKWKNVSIHGDTTLNDTIESGLLKDLKENIQGIEDLLCTFIPRIEERRKMLSNANIPLNINAWKAAEKRYTEIRQSNNTYTQNIHRYKIPIIKLTILNGLLNKYMVKKYYNTCFDGHHTEHAQYHVIENVISNSGDLETAVNSPQILKYNMRYSIKSMDNDSHITVGFIHILSDAIVLPEGEVLYKDVKLHPGGCWYEGAPKLTN